MVFRGWCAIAGAVLIVGGCGADGSTTSTPEGTTAGTSLATAVAGPVTSAAPSMPATTTNVVMSTASIAAPTVVSVPLGYSMGPHAVAEALEAARTMWSDANVSNYRLIIAENRNYWSAGCRWNVVVTEDVVTESEVDPSSTSSTCMPNDSTVEQLHEMISYWLDNVSGYADPEFGDHTLNVQFNEIGVPLAMEYDLANGADEESSMHVTFTPSA
jgi:hypothetical protein